MCSGRSESEAREVAVVNLLVNPNIDEATGSYGTANTRPHEFPTEGIKLIQKLQMEGIRFNSYICQRSSMIGELGGVQYWRSGHDWSAIIVQVKREILQNPYSHLILHFELSPNLAWYY
jgi:hypothetical protein